jgi:hypothetical protein
MSKNMKKFCVLIILLIFYQAVSCSSENFGSGNLLIRWKIGGMSCLKANVANVKILLLQDETLINESTESCVAQEHLFTDIPAGSYRLDLQGLTLDNKFVYEGSDDSVTVSSGKTIIMNNAVVLTERKASLTLKWKFENGQLCAYNGVELMEVSVWDEHSNKIFFEYINCNPQIKKGQSSADGYLIENLDSEELNIEIFGLDIEGSRLFTGSATVLTEHGVNKVIEIELFKCDNVKFLCY